MAATAKKKEPVNIEADFAAWQRASLPMILLAEMNHSPGHGYALSERMASKGLAPVKGAALYPALKKLEQQHFATATWKPGQSGPGRKVYEITDRGREYLTAITDRFHEFAAIIDHYSEE